MTDIYGIIGNPLQHSFSPGYFKDKFSREQIDAEYRLFELADIKEFGQVLGSNPALKGLNVTIPYKKTVIPFLHEVDTAAKAIGAVNCIRINNNQTKGYNTDIIGFRKSLEPMIDVHHKQALVLGTGGSSNAVAHVLEELGIAYVKVSRQAKKGVLTYTDITHEMIGQCKLIINTTPVGMHPNENAAPDLPYESLTSMHLLYDLVYNPAETKFLALGAQYGAATKNGMEMLHLQAEASWDIWQG